jgi:hypothetical protein
LRFLICDTLFVFAKAAQGPAIPLAIARLTVAQLPARVTLTDAMSMMPNVTLSKFPRIILGARISKSGNAIAQSGDFQTLSAARFELSGRAYSTDHRSNGRVTDCNGESFASFYDRLLDDLG